MQLAGQTLIESKATTRSSRGVRMATFENSYPPRNYKNCGTSPQSNLRRACRSLADKTSTKLLGLHSPSMLSPFKTSLAEWHSARLGTGRMCPYARIRCTALQRSKMSAFYLGIHYTGVSRCCVCFVAFLHLNFSSTPNSILNLTIS